ncbi:hypothetical protein [Arenimonas sp. MALMAid1274]|uniref:hypothetical protein n=1 Tax=Arenimonas sp. MALMAid1274 TaxID=3411630 RepID=UPI003BA13465
MKIVLLAVVLFANPVGAKAPGPDAPPVLAAMTDAMLLDRHPAGAVIETRLDADFNGDGLVDTAYVARVPDEWRKLAVMMGYAEETDMGHEPAGEAEMDPYPLGSATLSVKKGVLLVEDLAGGTSATASTYRYRFDPAQRRMRLIGDDVAYYSRTNQHDKVEISTNRLTGQRIRQVFKLDADGYAPQPPVKEAVPTAPVYMEDAPLPDVTLGLGEAG